MVPLVLQLSLASCAFACVHSRVVYMLGICWRQGERNSFNVMQLRCSVGEASELFIKGSNVNQCFEKKKLLFMRKLKNSVLHAFPPSFFDSV